MPNQPSPTRPPLPRKNANKKHSTHALAKSPNGEAPHDFGWLPLPSPSPCPIVLAGCLLASPSQKGGGPGSKTARSWGRAKLGHDGHMVRGLLRAGDGLRRAHVRDLLRSSRGQEGGEGWRAGRGGGGVFRGLIPFPFFPTTFFAKTDRYFPVSGGFLERIPGKNGVENVGGGGG